uniref:Uncharacterized protein n=1 Tax=Sphaerodactylus townsendi TaxID=933632 RepID=A0ACB8FWA7_9SAUR
MPQKLSVLPLQASLFQPFDSNPSSAGDPAVHFHVCELLDVLRALRRRRDGGDDVLQAQEHGEEQYEEDRQESQKEPHVHVQVGVLIYRRISRCSQGGGMSTTSKISTVFEIGLSHFLHRLTVIHFL